MIYKILTIKNWKAYVQGLYKINRVFSIAGPLASSEDKNKTIKSFTDIVKSGTSMNFNNALKEIDRVHEDWEEWNKEKLAVKT